MTAHSTSAPSSSGASPTTDKILARKDGSIGWLIFNQPERRNAVSLEMWQAIPGVLADFAADPAIRVVVSARLGSKKPAALLPALVLNGPDGRFTPQSEALHRGEAGLA